MVAARPALLYRGLGLCQPEPGLALGLRLAPSDHIEGQPRVLLGALQRAGAEHLLNGSVGCVEVRRERGEAGVTVAALPQPIAERAPRDTSGLGAVPKGGAHAPGCDERGVHLAGKGEGAGSHGRISPRTWAAMERMRSGGTLLPMRAHASSRLPGHAKLGGKLPNRHNSESVGGLS